MPQEIIRTEKNISLWTESFGLPTNLCVLLIAGSGDQAIFWPDEFCQKIAATGFFVLRYDHRDTGQSTHIDYDKSPYSLFDITSDAIEILNAKNIQQAHVVGFSMGGYIAQLLAVHFSKRILSITLIASSCNSMPMSLALKGENTEESALPPPTIDFVNAYYQEAKNRDEEIAIAKIFNGNKISFDENYFIHYSERFNAREQKQKTSSNHSRARDAYSQDRTELLKSSLIPSLIIHGDSDPAFPIEHALFTAKLLQKSKLVIIKNMGHNLNPIFHNQINSLLIEHFKRYSYTG